VSSTATSAAPAPASANAADTRPAGAPAGIRAQP
jgi:hypothetical protein